jgi:arylsulfatase A-like enzyme
VSAKRWRGSRAWLASALVAVALALFAAPAPSAARRPNLLLVVVDTLRADRLGAYGNTRGLTPFLDSLAARGTVFRRAYAQSSWTNPSIASLFTSRFPSEHGVVANPRLRPAPADDEVTLAELLREHGYATGAFVANSGMPGVADDPRTAEEPIEGAGFGQGFEVYRVRVGHPVKGTKLWQNASAVEVNQPAVFWLKRTLAEEARPVFLYVHYMEPHIPYAPRPAIFQRLSGGRRRPNLERVNAYARLWRRMPAADAAMRAALGDAYDAAVMSVDRGIAELFSDLAETGFLDDALVVVTADHGEEFFEHGILGHGSTLYDPVIRVPLLMLTTAGPKARTDVSDVVSLIDVAPTLLDRAGVARPESFRGVSLAPHLGERTALWRRITALFARPQPPPAFCELVQSGDWERETPHRHAVVAGDHKLIAGVDGTLDFYDLATDPMEMHPSATNGREELQRALAGFVADVGAETEASAPTAAAEPDPETLERMRALGYAE